MKRTLKLISFLLALVFALSAFTACELNLEELLGQFGGDPGVVVKEMVTIQWVQGQKVLKEEVVEKGSKLTYWEPTAEGMEFQGWYERPYIKKFDFEKTTVKESMRIYAYFKSATGGDDGEQEVDASIWYLIGAGKGDLGKCNNWNHEAAAKNVGMKLGEDGIYRVTLNIYAGDQFKITRNLGWDEEMAIDKMAGFADGKVTDENGTVVFTAGDNNNIVLAEGQDGKYEISYDESTGLISFKFIEALESLPDDIRLIGDANGWSTVYGEEDFKFTSEDNENWTFTWEVTSPMKFKVYNNLSGVYYPGGVDNDLHIDVAGTYIVHFNSKTREVVVKDENGNVIDVGFSNDGGNEGGGSTGVIPNANPVDKVYVVLNSTWNDGSLMSAWVWLNDGEGQWADFVPTEDPNVYEVNTAGFNKIVFVDFNADTADKNWEAKREQTGDLAIPDQSDDRIYYHVGAATWTNSSEAGDVGGGSGSDVTTTEAITIYFRNDWMWTNVSCHYWGEGGESAWPGAAMTKVGSSDGYEVYSIELPAGTKGFLFTGVKNDGSGATDQSPDVSVEGVIDGQGFKMEWHDGNAVVDFTYDPTACVHNYVNGVCQNCSATIAYTIAGSDTLCGTSWDTNNTENDMEYDADAGVFKKVYSGLAAGSYEFKVVQDHSWSVNWGQGGQNGANFVVEVANAGSTVTITFDGTNVTYTVE